MKTNFLCFLTSDLEHWAVIIADTVLRIQYSVTNRFSSKKGNPFKAITKYQKIQKTLQYRIVSFNHSSKKNHPTFLIVNCFIVTITKILRKVRVQTKKWRLRMDRMQRRICNNITSQEWWMRQRLSGNGERWWIGWEKSKVLESVARWAKPVGNTCQLTSRKRLRRELKHICP